MVFRKPYAFLIKNFKNINLALLILSFFVYYRVLNVSSFVHDYILSGSYNQYVDPISRHITPLTYFILLIIIAILTIVVFLLKKKQKPTLGYFLAFLEYTYLFILFIIINNYFVNAPDVLVHTTAIRAIKDLLFIGNILQYAFLILYIIRLLGIDLKKFGFMQDEEFMLINDADREEVELSLEFDKDIFKRTYNRLKRNLQYFYLEHKFICKLIITSVLLIITIRVLYVTLILNKAYNQKEPLNANGYTITINNSYLTNYDKKGQEIDKKRSFIILDVTVKNNAVARQMDVERFVLSSKELSKQKQYYYPTLKLNNYFTDLGTGYVKSEFKTNKTYRFTLIYDIPRNTINNKYILYYSEVRALNDVYLRKINLNMTKYITQSKTKAYNLNDNLTFDLDKEKKSFIITSYELNNNFSYLKESCSSDDICGVITDNVSLPNNYSILKIDLDSADYTGPLFIDFLSSYGNIIYRVNSKTKTYNIINAIATGNFKGSSIYLKVPKEITTAKEVYLSINIRNNIYNYYIVGGNNE